MSRDNSSEMINQLKTWIEERFRSLHAASSDEQERDEAMARYRKLASIVHQLEGLGIPIPEDVESEKATLEEFLHTPNEEESELVFLSKELSSLAKNINHRLRGMRSQNSSKGKKGPRKRLRVEFSDGAIIDEAKAIDTFVESIRHIGLQHVSKLLIKQDGRPLVSTQEPESSMARKFRQIDGYFINTHSGTNGKAKPKLRLIGFLRV